MADYSFINDECGNVCGLWFRNPNDAQEGAVPLLLAKNNIPIPSSALGSFRIVPNTYDRQGGCFVMFDSTLAPGEQFADSKTMGNNNQVLLEIASAVVGEAPESMKIVVVSDNYIAGAIKKFLIKAKGVSENRITNIDSNTKTFPPPTDCDIVVVSTTNSLHELKLIPPALCKEVVLFKEHNGKVETHRKEIPADRKEGIPLIFNVKSITLITGNKFMADNNDYRCGQCGKITARVVFEKNDGLCASCAQVHRAEAPEPPETTREESRRPFPIILKRKDRLYFCEICGKQRKTIWAKTKDMALCSKACEQVMLQERLSRSTALFMDETSIGFKPATDKQPTLTTKYCKHCGASIPFGPKPCEACGKSV